MTVRSVDHEERLGSIWAGSPAILVRRACVFEEVEEEQAGSTTNTVIMKREKNRVSNFFVIIPPFYRSPGELWFARYFKFRLQ
jgi:hypothetical protein